MGNNKGLIDSNDVSRYHRDGMIRIQLPSEVCNLLKSFVNECCAWIKHFAHVDVAAIDLARTLPTLARSNRDIIAKLYKVSRRFPSAKKLGCHPKLTSASARLMNVEFAACCHFINIRIDLPGEDKYLLPPHQDFPYIQDSINSVTWWIPFADTSVETGPPRFLLGTHKLGILPVKEFDYESTGRSGGKSFQIADETRFNNIDYSCNQSVPFGQAILFDTLLVHRSEPNNSSVARLSVQLRFSDPFSVDSFERNYPEGLYLGNRFSHSYPEYVIEN
jgi:ectoine hydroxylase-related dioxygenase (phytanoyl-CoA dioxygenase family)